MLSFIEVEVLLGTFHHCLVGFVEVLLGYHVSILSHCLHAGLLADACDVGCTDLVRSAHIQLQIDVLGQIHFRCYCLENQSFLASVWQRELDFTIESPGTEKSRVESVVSVG